MVPTGFVIMKENIAIRVEETPEEVKRRKRTVVVVRALGYGGAERGGDEGEEDDCGFHGEVIE